MFSKTICLLPLLLAPVLALPYEQQIVMGPSFSLPTASNLSSWSMQWKEDFVSALLNNTANEWTLVLGNEGGDLDSMISALTYAFHLTHLDPPKKAIALLQTLEDALDLRPENTLALKKAGMAAGHKDLLSLDDLPMHRYEVAEKIGAIVLVDHPQLHSSWGKAGPGKVTGIIDHHKDRGSYPNANPRVVQMTASCSTLTANELLKHGSHKHLPIQLVDLLLSVIALDSDAFSKGPADNDLDREVSKQLLEYSSFKGQKLQKVAKKLDKELSKAKKALDHLSIRDLLRRDYKGDIVTSHDNKLSLHLGMASMPIPLEEQINRTVTKTITEWFAIESKWTVEELGADISLALTSFKDEEKNKKREIVLVVKAGGRLTYDEAVDLFNHVVADVESSSLPTKPSEIDLGHSFHKRKVWWNEDPKGGRKVVRPIVEASVIDWLNKKAHSG